MKRTPSALLALTLAELFATVSLAAAGPSTSPYLTLVPEKVKCAVSDVQDFQVPDRVHLEGWIGMRVAGNESARLARIDSDRLLEGYRKRPGRQSWDGEHVGKWLHASTLAWANTGDPALRQKLDQTVAELLKCQLDDGYLGTYLEKDRWTEWDVWAHKYNLIGLITYIRYTGNQAPLPACRRMADLLCRTFGDGPGQRDIIKAGHHVGMAPTSVLEPMVLLHRLTGEPRYLHFSKYILRSWEQSNGPHIASTLLSAKRVDKVGNGKAYEMLSCLNGALEYYRTIGGDRQIFDACLNAWQDIVDKRLYLTGAASYHELFHDDFDLPNNGNVGETCVTVTWLQFNAQLLRLTGEARFAEQLERVVLNQLFGAQRPDCAAWGYYVQMEGKKPYSDTLDGHCCLSSGPRGVALIPGFAVTTDAEGVVANLYDKGTATLNLHDGAQISLAVETRYPADGKVVISIGAGTKKAFALKLRLPEWCRESSISVNGTGTETTETRGYRVIQRTWSQGDRIELTLKLEPRLIVGDHSNQGKVALLYGPLVLAADELLLPESGQRLTSFAIRNTNLSEMAVSPEPAAGPFKTWAGAQVFSINAAVRKSATPVKLRLIPFAEAGGTGSNYKVWLPLPRRASSNLLFDEAESRSREGNLSGAINDDDLQNPVVTFNNKPAKEDWYAITLDTPASIWRIVFTHGKSFHDGGWFDASVGKPRVQVQREREGAWETIGELTDYPPATATNDAGLKPAQAFTLKLAQPMKVSAVRVIGIPACGDNPKQAFSSCAELQAFAE